MRKLGLALAFLIGWLIGSSYVGAQEIQHLQSFRVGVQETWDSRDVKFIELKSPKGTVLLSGDADLEIIKSLRRHVGERIVVTIDYPEAR